MQLCKLTEKIPGLRMVGDAGVEISSIVYDSRKVTPGAVFVALRGLRHNGADYVREAIRKGAAAVMLREGSLAGAESSVSLIISREPRKDMAIMAGRLCGSPAQRLRLVGVTGTNGKTTITYIAESILRAAGKKTGVIGTISYRVGRSEVAARQTTPEAVDLQYIFRDMVDAETEFCLLEVSSHALDMHRILGSSFEAAVFTNLSQDHLDFHGDMESYFGAKRRLFRQFPVGTAIINTDDPWGRRLVADCPGEKITYGFSGEADVSVGQLQVSMQGLRFALVCPQGSFPLQSSLTGEHNVYNILAASAIALALGADIHHIQEGVAALGTVPGRFQRIDEGQDFAVIVDYAHTEDALRKLLAAARKLCRGRLIVLFGCGGDRDKGKRPLMGRVAAELSDFTVITSDNPRSEDPLSIIRQIEQGFLGAGGEQVAYVVVPQRREAIRRAVSAAGPGDVVLIAGKGHERHQIVGDRRLPFDDVEEARVAITESVAQRAC